MLNDEKTFEELIIAIQNVNTAIPLPLALRPKLWNRMEVLDRCKDVSVLEREGEVPKNAYYVVKGFAMVYGYDERTDEYVWRIYRPGSIVALNCFMHRKKSMYTIKASKRALLWSVSADVMKEIYKEMEGMREFALQTSAEYDNRTERGRNLLLALELDDRVRKFYKYYPGLLPARKSPVPDDAVASFLAISKYQLQRTRNKLIRAGILRVG
ncbi:Crp/Fnr family transcriptional regulator [Pedobacter ginsengisoli]|uniref:Crp/Fnr family transcriptional regulator n=1 Tax=Pedobacter ginsengisoli TaxID=363852 RepID=UPI00254AD072|nr:cyclic nucleotide-binding domain-containing protein [Pedobacter ginsengisoli]